MTEPLNLKDQIAIAVSLAEGQFREFKTALAGRPGEKQNRAVKEICRDVGEALVAFANADGGELLIGVEDDGSLTGTQTLQSGEVEIIKQAYKTHVHPDTPLQSVLVRDVLIGKFQVIYFRISKSTTQVHLTSDGRCLRRNDLESVPVPAERIQFDRKEIASREYDREFVDGASVADLDNDILRIVADQVSPGISVDRCLQYLGLAEYDGQTGLRLRKAALLLFAKKVDKWHPRVQVRIIKIEGAQLNSGAAFNVKTDETIKDNILTLLDKAWDELRPHLVETRFHEDARFRTTYIYPEVACREALVNAIAHRDYSEEGVGIDIFVFSDRIEVANPGGLLSSMSLADITALRGVHQSRNSYIARALRELGAMRELGEGMRRIFEQMKSNELAPPSISTENRSFRLSLHHRAMYNKDEALWLSQYSDFSLSAEEKSFILIGRRGDLIAPNDVIRRLGIVDIEHYRQVVFSLQTKGILLTAISKMKAKQAANSKGVGIRDIARFKIATAEDIARLASERAGTKLSDGQVKSIDLGDADVEAGSEADQRKIYVANIPPNTTDRDLSSAFKACGTPVSIEIPKAGGLSKGYGYMEFETPEMAAAAVASTVRLGGRLLVIRYDSVRVTTRRRRRRNGSRPQHDGSSLRVSPGRGQAR